MYSQPLSKAELYDGPLVLEVGGEPVGIEVPLVQREALSANHKDALIGFHVAMEQEGRHEFGVIDEYDVLLGVGIGEEEPAYRLVGEVHLKCVLLVLD